jgi:hypothetical protein
LVEHIIISSNSGVIGSFFLVGTANLLWNYYYGFLRCTKWEKLQGISDADVLPAKPIHAALYLTCLVQHNSSSGPKQKLHNYQVYKFIHTKLTNSANITI